MKTCDIRIGTCGFSYRDWKEVFYPPSLSTEDYLAYYSRYFNFLEVDYTYYRMPEATVSRRLCDRVPDTFLFSVKLTGNLTHERGEGWESEAKGFIEGIRPYSEEQKLGALLAQFPYSFHYTGENRLYLAHLCDRFQGLPLSVEFRNNDWHSEKVYKELEDRKIILVQPDLPELKGLPEADGRVTGAAGYLRFHGRNRENWWKGTSVSRYDYLYSREELQRRLEMILDMAFHAARLFLAFNNHHKGQAVKNALELSELLREKTGDLSDG